MEIWQLMISDYKGFDYSDDFMTIIRVDDNN